MPSAASTAARQVEFDPYVPLVAHPHVNTTLSRYWPLRLEAGEERRFSTEAGVTVVGRLHRHHPAGPLMLVVHGLEGSIDSNYMKWMTRAALGAGFDVLRLNVRNCGGTDHLSPTLYHSGLTADLRAVVEQLRERPLVLVGFSMSGNQALKLAGEWGALAPPHLAAVCAISAPIDLAACARRIAEPQNRFYERIFLKDLGARVERKARLQPERFSTEPLAQVRTIIDFDHYITAPAFGFRDAWDYYRQSSAAPHLEAIRVPALIIQAKDDPLIPFESFRQPENPAVRLLATDHGGHVGFVARGRPRFWAAAQVVRFCGAVLSHP